MASRSRSTSKDTLTSGAVIYLRISEDREGRELGVDRQREDCLALAERLGLPVLAIFTDNDKGASRRSKKRRPDFETMMAGVQASRWGGGKVAVLCYKASRLTRKPREVEDFIDYTEAGLMEINTVAEGKPDLLTANGQMLFRFQANVNTAYSDANAEQIARDAERRRTQGWAHGGSTPFGYRAAGKGALTVVEEEAECVREGARMILIGKRLMEVAHEWNRRGVTRLNGEPWTDPQQVRNALSAIRICGWTSHDGEFVAKGQWQPIIDRDTFEAVRVMLDQRKGTNPGGGKRRFLLSGYVYCGAEGCGHPMVVNGPRYICRDTQRGAGKACGSLTRHKGWLEAAVQGYVFTAIANGYVPQGDSDKGGSVDLSGRITDLEDEIERLMAAYRAKVFTLEEIGPQVAPLRVELEELKGRRRQQEIAAAADTGAVGLELIGVWQDASEDTLAQRREILARYVKRVEVLPVGRGRRPTAGSIRIVEPGGRVLMTSQPDSKGDPFLAWSTTPLTA